MDLFKRILNTIERDERFVSGLQKAGNKMDTESIWITISDNSRKAVITKQLSRQLTEVYASVSWRDNSRLIGGGGSMVSRTHYIIFGPTPEDYIEL